MELNDRLDIIKNAYGTEKLPDVVGYNESVRNAWEPIWSRNGARTYQAVEKIFKTENHDLGQLPKVQSEPCLILGSGPSLDDLSPLIKDWKGHIFCSTSQLAWLEYHKVKPTYCNLIDSDPQMVYLMEQYKGKTILITHPQAPREALEAWKGDIYFYLMRDPGSDFQTKYIPWMYGLLNEEKGFRITSNIMNLGNVMNANIAVAQQLGYSPIFLCGYDLGYPEGQYRFTNYERKDGEWNRLEDLGIPEGRGVVPGNNGVLCDNLCWFYKYSFMIMWGLGSPPVISCSRGILSEIPHVNIEHVIRCQGRGEMPALLYGPWQSYKIAQTYLKNRGMYVLKGPKEQSIKNIGDVPKWKRPLFLYKWWRKHNDKKGWPKSALLET